MGVDSVARSLAISALNSSGGAVSSVNGKTGTVTLYGTDINMSTDTSLPTVTEQISSNKTNIGDLATQMGNKQDKLTAGTNITIDANNVISATGGSSYTAGDGIEIANNVISTDDDYIATIPVNGAYQLISSDGQLIEGDFIARTTGGSASISAEGDASFIKWEGNSTNPTYVAASVSLVNPTNATVNNSTYIAYAKSQGDATGTKVFTADDANYGITLNGDASATASYIAENLGTIVNATPTSFTSLGFNLYDHTNTRVYTISGNRYQVFGSYTSVGTETMETNVTVGSYTIPTSFVATVTGYQTVTGGNSTDTMVALVWSGYNYNHTYESYDAETISFTDVTGWGLPRVNGVYDEVNFETQKYIKRIGRDVVANKDLYDNKIYDSTYVYYVLSAPVESTLTITKTYTANDFGEEIFAGTTVPVGVEILYGQNLKDKLRTDVLTISAQSLTSAQQNQVKTNLNIPQTITDYSSYIKVTGNTYYNSVAIGNAQFSGEDNDKRGSLKAGSFESYSAVLGSEGSVILGRSTGSGVGFYTEGTGSLAHGFTNGSGQTKYQANIIAAGAGSHAEGYSIIKSGIQANAGGSHAEGYAYDAGSMVIANATGSHAEGTGTQAYSPYQHVSGKYNVRDSSSTYAFIIGNGTSNSARSNALTVDWNGNLVCNNIPAPPSTDGTYNLQCSIVDGVITYSWVVA